MGFPFLSEESARAEHPELPDASYAKRARSVASGPRGRGVLSTSSGETQIEPTRHALALTRVAGCVASTAAAASREAGVVIVMATRPPCQYASHRVLSTYRRSEMLLSRGESRSVSVTVADRPWGPIGLVPTVTLCGTAPTAAPAAGGA